MKKLKVVNESLRNLEFSKSSECIKLNLCWRGVGEDEGIEVKDLFIRVKYGKYFYVGRMLGEEYFKVLYDEYLLDDIKKDYEDDESYICILR